MHYTCSSTGLDSAANPVVVAMFSTDGGVHEPVFHGTTLEAYNSSTSSKESPFVSGTQKNTKKKEKTKHPVNTKP